MVEITAYQLHVYVSYLLYIIIHTMMHMHCHATWVVLSFSLVIVIFQSLSMHWEFCTLVGSE